ncbi:RING finger protein [Endozoicomonas sp. 8E]|uniref:RING finger protein n=1 Tax=Endozoicomonas sp. 8E TaxID=3035692 RepID=UPI0029390176|nr:RING finger protein [Endozoicomonas sp. 8E]WOG29221.1 RING finger protein [Endozoicomonas sp. 8E]
MTIECALKMLLFSVLLFFYQQGLANDTYDLEEFRQHQKKSWKPPSEKQQSCTDQPAITPLENIRIGFVRLNLASDAVSGDERLEICDDYEISEQDFNRLNNFYFDYVNVTEQSRKLRIQRMLRLMNFVFTININRTNGKKPEDKRRINAIAESLFEKNFLSESINDGSEHYFHYYDFEFAANHYSYDDVNKDLFLMTFLGPHFLLQNELYDHFKVLHNSYTRTSYYDAFERELLSVNINEYHSPQSLANQLNTAELDAGTALLIGLTAMASAAIQRINSGREWQETLETLLVSYLPYELLDIVYKNIAIHCNAGQSYTVPIVMFTVNGMQEFTHSILGIDPIPASSSERQGHLLDSSEGSGSDGYVEEPDSEHQEASKVIQQQNELIAELRRELANQSEREEAGAVGGASGAVNKCPLCRTPLEDIMLLQSCGHAGFCKNCAERIINEQRDCPFCREATLSFIRVIDMSFP